MNFQGFANYSTSLFASFMANSCFVVVSALVRFAFVLVRFASVLVRFACSSDPSSLASSDAVHMALLLPNTHHSIRHSSNHHTFDFGWAFDLDWVVLLFASIEEELVCI